MAKNKEKQKVALDRWLLGISLILTIIVVAISISLITFIGNQILKAFVPVNNNEPQIKFDFEGYESLSETLKAE